MLQGISVDDLTKEVIAFAQDTISGDILKFMPKNSPNPQQWSKSGDIEEVHRAFTHRGGMSLSKK